MSPKKENFDFSPSVNHKHILGRMRQSMAFSGGDVKKWQRKLRRKVKELLGDWPEKRCPLKAKSIWKQKHRLGTIEKIVFTSEPHADVPAYVCIPNDIKPPYPFVICLQGHSTGMHNSIGVDRENEKKKIDVKGDRDFAIGCLERKLPALCIEQRSFGLRRELVQPNGEQHGCYDATAQALLLGRTLIGERVFDVDRGIDYLYQRKDVDKNKVGVMGNSGGGTISLFSAAVLPRIKFAMPSCYFCTFEASIMSVHHCIDNYVPGLLKYAEMPDVMGLFAPKPLVIVAGKEDNIFPIKGVRKAYRHLNKIYRAAGAEKNCHLVVGNEGHRFYAEPTWKKMLPMIDKL